MSSKDTMLQDGPNNRISKQSHMNLNKQQVQQRLISRIRKWLKGFCSGIIKRKNNATSRCMTASMIFTII